MSDINHLESHVQEEEKTNSEASEQEGEHSKAPTSTTATMSEIEQPQTEQTGSTETVDSANRKGFGNTSFSIWPPTQRTRDAVTNRLIETLSSPSVLSKRYGVVPHDEASEAAKRIEGEAFNAAGATASADDDGIEILQVYSKEISRRMLDIVKSRSASSTATPDAAENKPEGEAVAVGDDHSEGTSAVKNES